MKYQLTNCTCGSTEQRYAKHDGHGIFLFYCCSKCEAEKLKKYRDDILIAYHTDEPIEEE